MQLASLAIKIQMSSFPLKNQFRMFCIKLTTTKSAIFNHFPSTAVSYALSVHCFDRQQSCNSLKTFYCFIVLPSHTQFISLIFSPLFFHRFEGWKNSCKVGSQIPLFFFHLAHKVLLRGILFEIVMVLQHHHTLGLREEYLYRLYFLKLKNPVK